VATVRPFQGIVYNPQQVDVARVVAPPYDVVGPDEQRYYYGLDPHNVVRLIAGIVKPTDTPEDSKYTRAAAFFKAWLSAGVLQRERRPCFYVYRETFHDPNSGEQRARTGVLAGVELQPFGQGVLAHERTHTRPKADRLSLTEAVAANLSPIFMLYEGAKASLPPMVASIEQDRPRLHLESGDVEHDVWVADSPEQASILASALSGSMLYIADGHHRYETALNYRDRQRRLHPDAPADAAFNYVLTYLVDASDPALLILPTHRMLHDLESFDSAALLRRLEQKATIGSLPVDSSFPSSLVQALSLPLVGRAGEGVHRILLVLPGPNYFTLDFPRRSSPDPVECLDVTVLHEEIFEAELGLHEGILESERHLSYSRDAAKVLGAVDTGAAQAAFLLRPPSVADVLAVARAGRVMPQKSTFFYPKPLSGIALNPLDPAIRIPAPERVAPGQGAA
jgi:uncharacterized protein (DUF1015 family)